MKLDFTKMVGCGNDFVVLQNFDKNFDYNPKLVQKICQQKFGIGADGLLVLENSGNSKADFKMRYFNADGYEVDFCGNGARTIFNFAFKNGISKSQGFFEASDGLHFAEIINDSVKLKMKSVLKEEIQEISILENLKGFFLNTGVPHFVSWQENLKDANFIKTLGSQIRFDKNFQPNGTNANFVEILDENKIFVRTFERGVEDETLSCGTGVVASAIASKLSGRINSNSVEVKTLGGNLSVNFSEDLKDIFLTGNADFVFEGKIDLI